MKALPDLDVLSSHLRYDETSGNLVWKTQTEGHRAGAVAGSKTQTGYVDIWIGHASYKAHRIVWKLLHGKDPVSQIDHIDGDRSNNRISNLREATPSQNVRNMKVKRAGLKGAYRLGKKWISQLGLHGEKRYLGIFETEEEAHAAYVKASQEYFGEFARSA